MTVWNKNNSRLCLERLLSDFPLESVQILAEAMSAASSPSDVRAIADLAACYIPLNERHKVIIESGDPVLKIEHLGILSGPVSLGSCIDFLDSVSRGDITLDSMLVTHLSSGDSFNRTWPILAAAGHRFDHNWLRSWSSEQMVLALSVYSNNTARLGELSAATLGGWAPSVFEHVKTHLSALSRHIQRALRACSMSAPHLMGNVIDLVTPDILLSLLSSNSVQLSDAAEIIKRYDDRQVLEMINTTHIDVVMQALLDVRDFIHLGVVMQDKAALSSILNLCEVRNSEDLIGLATALDIRMSVRERLQASASLTSSSTV